MSGRQWPTSSSCASSSGSIRISTYVLDTSALLTYFNDEPGKDELIALFQDTNNRFVLSFLSLFEIYYTTFRSRSEEEANERLRITLGLGFDIDYQNNLDSIKSAGGIKAEFRMSVADAWIAALALRERATLIHKDPEFEVLKDHIDLLTLPYK